jgi:hypothetical protein
MVALGSTLIDTAKFGSNDVTAFYLGSNEAWTANKPGMVLLTDYTITHAGTSATLTNGQVTFTAVTSLSLNGVFSADFDNYVIAWSASVSAGTPGVFARLRSSGTDASGTNYTQQYIVATSTTIGGARTTSATSFAVTYPHNTSVNGSTMHFYGPFLAQPTAHRSVSVDSVDSARLTDTANTHSLSTSYDGITIFPGTGDMTGKLTVMGVRS